MSDKDLELLVELAKEKLRKGVSKEDAIESFVKAGIMDSQGEYTEPYRQLEELAS